MHLELFIHLDLNKCLLTSEGVTSVTKKGSFLGLFT